MNDLDNSDLSSLGYTVAEIAPNLYEGRHNDAVISQSVVPGNCWAVCRAHLRAQSEGALVMKQLARDLKSGRR